MKSLRESLKSNDPSVLERKLLDRLFNREVHPDVAEFERQQAILRRLPPVGHVNFPYGWIGPGNQYR